MTPSCPTQFVKPAAGSINKRTVDPRVSARHFVLPTAIGSGAIMIVDLLVKLNPVSSRYFRITFPAIFNASVSLNGQTPLRTRSSDIPSIVFEVLRSGRPTKKTAFSGSATSYAPLALRGDADSTVQLSGRTNSTERP